MWHKSDINLLSADASAGEEAVNSRSSTPLEEEKYKVSELQLKMRYDARPAPRPRCRDYDGIFFQMHFFLQVVQ